MRIFVQLGQACRMWMAVHATPKPGQTDRADLPMQLLQQLIGLIRAIAHQHHVTAGFQGGYGALVMFSPATLAPSMHKSSLKITPSKPIC